MFATKKNKIYLFVCLGEIDKETDIQRQRATYRWTDGQTDRHTDIIETEKSWSCLNGSSHSKIVCRFCRDKNTGEFKLFSLKLKMEL